MEYDFYFYLMGCCHISSKKVFYPFRMHGNQGVRSVISDVSEHNLLNIEEEPADMCEHLGIFTKYRTHCASWTNWS